MRTLAAELPHEEGADVELAGWIHRVRDLGKICFVVLRDRSGLAQVVADAAPEATLESVIRVRGKSRENPRAPGGWELAATSIELIAPAEPGIPIQVNADPDSLSLESALDQRFLSLRNPKALGAFRVQATILEAFATTLRSQGFTEVKTSKLVATGTEGGSGLFEVDYFGQRAYLAQSPQFYKQAMVASGLERVFEIGQAYRAEKHDTPRHLNEYCSLDLELAFIESELDLIELERRLFSSIFEAVSSRNSRELSAWGARVPTPEEVAKAPVVGHDEAIEIANREAGTKAYEITPEVERAICAWSERERGSDLVFVNEFPRKHRPFYAYPKGRSTMSFDCIFRGLEVTTGGRRINEYTMLKESFERNGMEEGDYAAYASIFKYGCPPHGGFAIGLERLTQKIMGFQNVRQASLFPRDRHRLTP